MYHVLSQTSLKYFYSFDTKNEKNRQTSLGYNLTLKYKCLTSKMASDGVKSSIIELAILKNSNLNVNIVYLALLNVILARDPS